MRIFIAGATGVLGRATVPLLVAAGHEVHGVARSPEKANQLRAQGATPGHRCVMESCRAGGDPSGELFVSDCSCEFVECGGDGESGVCV